MFISEFSGDDNYSLASFTMLIYSMVKYNDKIDRFTNGDGDRLNEFKTYDNISNLFFNDLLISNFLIY